MSFITFDYLQIKQDLITHIADRISDSFNRNRNSILEKVKTSINISLRRSPEVQSLLGGVFQAEFGFISPSYMTEPILKNLIDNISISIQRTNSLLPIISIQMFSGNYSALLNLPTAGYLSYPSKERIPWLEWLLTKGSNTLVFNYSIEYGFFEKSRSKKATMVETPGISYSLLTSGKVNPSYLGTEDDNFITRAIEPSLEDIVSLVFDEIARKI